MGKYIGVRIGTFLCPVFINICLRQHFPVSRHDLSSHNPVREGILSGIIRAVDKILTLYSIKIDQIPDHTDKDQYEKAGYKCIFQISWFSVLNFPGFLHISGILPVSGISRIPGNLLSLALLKLF